MENFTPPLLGGMVMMSSTDSQDQFGPLNFPPAQPPPTQGGRKRQLKRKELTPLSTFVRKRLAELGVRQTDFCRQHHFDQGLMSKIQNSVINNLSLETALRLAIGLSVPPEDILKLIDRMDLNDLVVAAYDNEWNNRSKTPPQLMGEQ